MIVDSFVFSVSILFIAMGFNIEISSKEIVKQLFPITFQCCWFVGCYLFLYALHPCLNRIIYVFPQNIMLRVTLVMFILYSVLSTLIGGAGYYYSFLIAFIMIYFIVAYVKRYLHRLCNNLGFNIFVIVLGIFGVLFTLAITNFVGLKIRNMSELMLQWNIFSNPFIIMMSVGLFNVFRNVHFTNSYVNTLSSLTLYVYLIHENPIICRTLKPLYFEHSVYGTSLASVAILILATLFSCFPLSWLYKTVLQKKIFKVWSKHISKVKAFYVALEDRLLQIR